MMSDEQILFTVESHIARVTLNRPDSGNSMDIAFTERLMDIAEHCASDKSVRAVLITAKGKMFSVGGDLKGFVAMGEKAPQGVARMTACLHSAIARFARCNAPVVAAVQGPAAGAGMSLAAACDITLVAESAKFSTAYTAAGLTPDGSSSWFLPRLIGLRRTRDLLLTNRRLSATEAADWGLVDRVVPDDELQAQAEAMAVQMAAGPTAAYGAVKSLLRKSFDQGLETQMEDESQSIAKAIASADFAEGAAAFMEKRKPQFKGC